MAFFIFLPILVGGFLGGFIGLEVAVLKGVEPCRKIIVYSFVGLLIGVLIGFVIVLFLADQMTGNW